MAKKNSKKNKKKQEATDKPKIINAKGGLAQGAFLTEVLATMEDDLRLSKKQMTDFKDSFVAVVEREIGQGNPVNLFGLVKIVPRLHTKGQAMVNKEFGNPDAGKVLKKYPAKVSVRANVNKPIKESLPTVQKLQKAWGS